MTEPAHRYIVVRAAPDLPDGFIPDELEGRWYSLDTLPKGDNWTYTMMEAVAVPTDRFERRESDGATARVYEVRP